MAAKKRSAAKRAARKPSAAKEGIPASTSEIPEQVGEFLRRTSIPEGFVNPKPLEVIDLRRRTNELNVRPTVPLEKLVASVNRIKPAVDPVDSLPVDVKQSLSALKPENRRFHGTKIPLYWFPFPWLTSA